MQSKKRIEYLDNLKCFLIILVVLGHSIQFSNPDFDNVPLFRFIYAFHMPLFMWVSGYVNYRAVTQISIIKRRALQLALPFLVWVSFHVVKTGDLSYYVRVFYDPTISVWFIWDLFLIICFTTCINYWCQKTGKPVLLVTGIAFVLAEVIVKSFHSEVLGLSHALDMGLFYIMGYHMRRYDVFNRFVTIKSGEIV